MAANPNWRKWRTYKPPMYCRPFGGSDYCQWCGADFMGDNRNCEHLKRARLALIPEGEVAAFGCNLEVQTLEFAPELAEPCEKWCRSPNCPFTLKDDVKQ